MTSSGTAIFFDGATSARRDVAVELAPDILRIRAPDGTVLAEWPYDRLQTLSAPQGVLRLGKTDSPALVRLEVRDPGLAAAIDERSLPVDRSGRRQRRVRAKVIFWSLAATASLIVVAVWILPRIAPSSPPSFPMGSSAGSARRSNARRAQASTPTTRTPLSSAEMAQTSWPAARHLPN
jgi:hypothetical protein